MQSRHDPNAGHARHVALTLLLAVSLGACRAGDPNASRRASEALVLRKQIAGLRELVRAAEAGSLWRGDQIAIGLDEQVLRELIAATLPQESDVAARFRVRVETASVAFRASQCLVTLRGRVSPLGAPDTWALIQLEGSLEGLEVHAGTGRLTGRIGLFRFDVERAAAAGGESRVIRRLVEELGREKLEALAAVVPPFEIPVRLEQALEVGGLEAGAVRARPGRLPLRLSVARVVPFAGRLWVLIDASSGAWQGRDAAGGR